jgi:hypothetical protein
MSKKIQTDEIANELANGSLFFGPHARPVTSDSDETHDSTTPPARPVSRRTMPTIASSSASAPASTSDSSPASSQASTPAISRDSNSASTTASEQARKLASTLASSADLADAIYRVVKKTGKHVAYVRTTEREKAGLTAVLDSIAENHGYKVTETELIRIAICSLLADYAEKGSDSLLMRVVTDLKD